MGLLLVRKPKMPPKTTRVNRKKPRVIGDPLQKFRPPGKVIDQPPDRLRAQLEKMMDYDHAKGIALRAAAVINSKIGMPDPWFFEKARALGYQFEDDKTFWEEQIAIYKRDMHKPEYSMESLIEDSTNEMVHTIRQNHGDTFEADMIKTYGSSERMREAIRQQVMVLMEQDVAAAQVEARKRKL